MNWSHCIHVFLGVAIVFFASPKTRSFAGEQGHYVAGSWSPRDLIAAPPGTLAFAPYFSFYDAGRARNGSGEIIDGRQGVSAAADAFSFTPVLVYAPEIEVFGATWSLTVVPSWGETGSSASFVSDGQSINLFETNGEGLGDLYFVPGTLTWQLNEFFSLSAQYAVWLPVGEYRSSGSDNVGLGYVSHDFRLTASYFPLGNPGVLLSASVVHEINGTKQGVDVRPAPHTSAEIGVSVATSPRFMVGGLVFGTWETGSARGGAAAEDGRDRMIGVGGEVTYWIDPGKLGATARLSKEIEVRDRFQGETFTIGANLLF